MGRLQAERVNLPIPHRSRRGHLLARPAAPPFLRVQARQRHHRRRAQRDEETRTLQCRQILNTSRIQHTEVQPILNSKDTETQLSMRDCTLTRAY